jgi:hypothetical protein
MHIMYVCMCMYVCVQLMQMLVRGVAVHVHKHERVMPCFANANAYHVCVHVCMYVCVCVYVRTYVYNLCKAFVCAGSRCMYGNYIITCVCMSAYVCAYTYFPEGTHMHKGLHICTYTCIPARYEHACTSINHARIMFHVFTQCNVCIVGSTLTDTVDTRSPTPMALLHSLTPAGF